LYSHTPNKDDIAVTNRTLPKNSGPNPKSSVMKNKKAPSLVGVDCHKKRNNAGLYIEGCLMALHSAST
jgi:hypothetical protein